MQDLVVSIIDILDRPGHYRDVVASSSMDGGVGLAALTDSPVRAGLRLESVVEGILATGDVRAETKLTCARCLQTFTSPIAVDVCELFVSGPGAPGSTDDFYPIAGEQIDLEPMVRDALVLALPTNPLCRDDCRGMCGRCGADLNSGTCSCTDDEPDPRWAALDELKSRLGTS
ncbi:MAG: hypothetical protein QOC87_2157 [Actinomycetota bacterium]|nr:hypothetical protein [Actinomycetota bacterium]